MSDDQPLIEQTVCRRVVNGEMICGGYMARIGMTQEQTLDFRPDPNGRWFFDTRCDRCGRRMSIPLPVDEEGGAT